LSGLNFDDYVEELRYNIETKDSIKAGYLIEQFPELDPPDQNKILFELSRADDEFSIPLILNIYINSGSFNLDEDNIREILFRKIKDFPFALLEIIQNDYIKDKSMFIEWAGIVQCNNCVPVILDIIRKSTDDRLSRICLTALGKIGNPKAINEISDYLYSGNRELTLTAIDALEEIATPEAINRLSDRLGTDIEIDRKILHVFAKTQNQHSLDMLNRQLLSHNASLRNFAITSLTEIGSKAVPFLIENLSDKNSDLLIHSLTILGSIGDKDAAQPIRKLLFNEPEDANVRFAAYEAFGRLPLAKGAYVLTEGLVDSAEQVQVAAARALERNIDATVIAGIKNLIKEDNEVSEQIVRAFINAESAEIFIHLISSEVFEKRAIDYLAGEAHPDVRSVFENVLKNINRKDLLKKITSKTKTGKETEKPLIFAVDDSRMILKIYKSSLHQLGYPMQLFEFPETALEELKQERPQILITDLNMPKMNGIELTEAVRKIFSKDELPILMVTTQQDLADREAAFNAGINGILYKPFTKEKLEAELNKFLD